MTVYLSALGGAAAQFFDNNGTPLAGGKLFAYSAGTTSFQTVYTTSAGTVPHPNPIVLDAAGRVPSGGEIWLSEDVLYKFVLKTSTDILIATWDNIAGINDVTIPPPLDNAEQIIYTAPFTGAVTSNVEAKVSQILSVKDFGAVGDGVADDTLALQRTFDAAYDSDAATLLPPGQYLITADIRIRRPIIPATSVTILATRSGDTPPTLGVYFERRMVVENITFNYVKVFASAQDGTDVIFTPLTFKNCSFVTNQLILGQTDVLTSGYAVLDCNFASRNSRFDPAVVLRNASNVTIEQNHFQEYESAIQVQPSLSLSSTNIKISNNVISNSAAYSIQLAGTSMNRISNVTIENNTIIETVRDGGSSSRGAIFAQWCCNVFINNNTISHRNNGINLRAVLGASIQNNVLNATTNFPCVRVVGCKNVEIFANEMTMTVVSGTYGILVAEKLTTQPYSNENILIQNNTLKGTSIGIKIEYTDNVRVLSNILTGLSAFSATAGLLWFESTVTRGYYYDNRFYGPSGTAVVNDAGANVTATPSAQTRVTATVPATSVAAPIITTNDGALNNAKSYVVTFTIGDASRLTQLVDDNNKKTMSAWMATVTGATLAWNSAAWNTSTGLVADIIQNGAAFDNFDTEEFWTNKSLVFIDRFNILTCRMFYSASTDQDVPLGLAAAQLEEYAWNTAAFRPPLVVDSVIFDAVGSGIMSSSAYNQQLSGRMAMGQKDDGTYVIVAVDGRTNVNGCTIAELASRMLGLGCVNAFNLDGGGSATLWYSGSVINTPSDTTGERAIPAVMYV